MYGDIKGKKFGMYSVISRAADNKHGQSMYTCRCDCGNVRIVSRVNLVRGNSTCCGCTRYKALQESKRLKPFEALYRYLLRSSKYPVELSYDDFLKFTNENKCHYCDAEIIWTQYYTARGHGRGHNLDRKDNSGSYSLNNCVVCCPRCNWAKGDHFTYEEWKQVGELIKSWSK